MNESTKQKITKALDYSGDDSGAYFNEGELEPLTPLAAGEPFRKPSFEDTEQNFSSFCHIFSSVKVKARTSW